MPTRYYLEYDRIDNDIIEETIRSQIITKYEFDLMRSEGNKELVTALGYAMNDEERDGVCDIYRLVCRTPIGSMEMMYSVVRIVETGTSFAFDADFLRQIANQMISDGIYTPLYEKLNSTEN